jgi:Zn finger protein HypA/HybF involved in hydrogenase expression
MAEKTIKIEVSECKCERCGHEWISKTVNPIACAKCKSPYWKIPRKERMK